MKLWVLSVKLSFASSANRKWAEKVLAPALLSRPGVFFHQSHKRTWAHSVLSLSALFIHLVFQCFNVFNVFWDPTSLQSLQNTRNSKKEKYVLSPEFGGRLTQLLTEHQAAPHWSFLTSRNCSWLWYCLLPISKVHFWILGWDFSKNSQKVHNHIKTTPDVQFNWDRVRVWVRGHNTDSDMDLLATPPRMPKHLTGGIFLSWLAEE